MHQFVVCLDNTVYPASLEPRKLYETLADPQAAEHGQIRVIDESGEEYLFPKSLFLELPLSEEDSEKIAKAA